MKRTALTLVALLITLLTLLAPSAAGAGTPVITVPAGNLSGTVAVTVTPQPVKRVTSVSLYVDGSFIGSDSTSPYSFSWNTTTVPDGLHTLQANALYFNGNVDTGYKTVTVANSPTPTIPTGLQATPGDGQVALSWNANPAGENVDTYQVYLNDENYDLSVSGTTRTVTGLTNDVPYSFRVSAHNAAGYGDWTAAVFATPTGGGPPPTLSSPIGHHNASSPGYWPPTNIEKYGYVSTEGPAPSGFVGLNLVYRSSITCGVGYTNLSEATCVANGWAMRDAGGNVLRSPWGGVLADPSIPAYQSAWAAATLQRITEQQEDGYWADDFGPRVDQLATCGCFPANYPNVEAFKQALLSFAQYMQPYFGSRGLKAAYNTQVGLDNDGSLNAAWFAQLGPYVDYVTPEGWMIANGTLRVSGPAWNQQWDSFRNLHRVAQSAGTGFLPYDYPNGNPEAQEYTLGTFMLDWDGTAADGFAVWLPGPVDAWIPFYDQALALGAPVAAPVDNGTLHTRAFANGTLTVDSGTGTATITLG